MRKSAKMVLLVSGKTSFEATKRTILPEEEKLIEPEKTRLNRGPNAGTWEAAWVHPTTNISDFDTGALQKPTLVY